MQFRKLTTGSLADVLASAAFCVPKLLQDAHRSAFRILSVLILSRALALPAVAQVITYSSNTTLSGDVFCKDLTVDPGVTLTTNGYNILCSGTVTNNGVIQSGLVANGGIGANESPAGATPGGAFPNSYGGSGGGGGGSAAVNLGPAQVSGAGGNTVVSGGSGGTEFGGSCGTGGAGNGGSTPTAPSITRKLIQSWYNQNLASFLGGAGGGGGAGSGLDCSDTNGAAGGSGAFGVYIQAKTIFAGAVNTAGQNGGSGLSGGGGGGGGGTIVFAYGTGGLFSGTYNTNGGLGGTPSDSNGAAGGNGGNGQVLIYGYGSNPPIPVLPLAALQPSQSVATTGATSFAISIGWGIPYAGNPSGLNGTATITAQCATGISLQFQGGNPACNDSGTASISVSQPATEVVLNVMAELTASSEVTLSVCGESNNSSLYCLLPALKVNVKSLTGIQNTLSFSGLSASGDTGFCPSDTSNGECFTIQQNFFIYQPSDTTYPSYWAQNVVFVTETSTAWQAKSLFQMFTVGSDGVINTSTLADCNYVLYGCNGGVLGGLPGYLNNSHGWKTLSSGTGFSSLNVKTTVGKNSNGTGDVIHYVTNLGSNSLGNFESHVSLELGSFISAGQQLGVSEQPPQLMLVSSFSYPTSGEMTSVNFSSPPSAGTASSQIQLLGGPWGSGANTFLGCTYTAEQSAGLFWSYDGTSFNSSEPNAGQGLAFVPGIFWFPPSC